MRRGFETFDPHGETVESLLEHPDAALEVRVREPDHRLRISKAAIHLLVETSDLARQFLIDAQDTFGDELDLVLHRLEPDVRVSARFRGTLVYVPARLRGGFVYVPAGLPGPFVYVPAGFLDLLARLPGRFVYVPARFRGTLVYVPARLRGGFVYVPAGFLDLLARLVE